MFVSAETSSIFVMGLTKTRIRTECITKGSVGKSRNVDHPLIPKQNLSQQLNYRVMKDVCEKDCCMN